MMGVPVLLVASVSPPQILFLVLGVIVLPRVVRAARKSPYIGVVVLLLATPIVLFWTRVHSRTERIHAPEGVMASRRGDAKNHWKTLQEAHDDLTRPRIRFDPQSTVPQSTVPQSTVPLHVSTGDLSAAATAPSAPPEPLLTREQLAPPVANDAASATRADQESDSSSGDAVRDAKSAPNWDAEVESFALANVLVESEQNISDEPIGVESAFAKLQGVVRQESDAARPEWLDRPPQMVAHVYRRVIASGPFSTLDQCYLELEKEAVKALNEYLQRQYDPSTDLLNSGFPSISRLGVTMDYVLREICTEQYVETIEASFGKMKQIHVLMEFGEPQRKFLLGALEAFQRSERVRAVSVAAGGALAALAVLFGLLQVDAWTQGAYTKRLFLGAPTAIIAVGALAALVVA